MALFSLVFRVAVETKKLQPHEAGNRVQVNGLPGRRFNETVGSGFFVGLELNVVFLFFENFGVQSFNFR